MKIKLPKELDAASTVEAIKQELEERGMNVTVTKRKRRPSVPVQQAKLVARRRARRKQAARSKRINRKG